VIKIARKKKERGGRAQKGKKLVDPAPKRKGRSILTMERGSCILPSNQAYEKGHLLEKGPLARRGRTCKTVLSKKPPKGKSQSSSAIRIFGGRLASRGKKNDRHGIPPPSAFGGTGQNPTSR